MDDLFKSLNINVDDNIKSKFKDFNYVQKLDQSHIGMFLRCIKKYQNNYYRGGYISKVNCGVIEIICLNGNLTRHIYDDKYHLFVATNIPKQHSKLRDTLENILKNNSNLSDNTNKQIKIIY